MSSAGSGRDAAAAPPARAGSAEWALRERVKELTCLYAVARILEQAGAGFDDAMRDIVETLPPAWQFPETAQARLALDGREWRSTGCGAARTAQAAPVVVDGVARGEVEVAYRDERPASGEGPFLREERALLDAVALHVGAFVARREAASEGERLREQLWRTERLGTVGQLAAGLAHELNEPLGAILGYAQLARGSFGLPDQTAHDLDKVVRASLRARDIIRRLLVFARSAPAAGEPVDVNVLVRESVFLLETRCRRAGVTIVLRLARDLPHVGADRALLSQALVNLAVNAVQAMPRGGRLTLATAAEAGGVALTVEDTGSGMDEETLRRCFDPFFTTKDVGQGTGMGLAVTHGIVTSHGGRIDVRSAPGEGTRFDVRLPVHGAAGGSDGREAR